MRWGVVVGAGVVWDEACRWEMGGREVVRRVACRARESIMMRECGKQVSCECGSRCRYSVIWLSVERFRVRDSTSLHFAATS